MELVEQRQSTRRYIQQPVSREKIDLCLEAARLAPSASNVQPWRFVVADDPQLASAIGRNTVAPFRAFNTFCREVPVFVAVVAEAPAPHTRLGGLVRRLDYATIDIGIAAEHFCLRATELGLGTCMLGWFDERAVGRLLGVPRRRRIYLLIALGHPADESVRPKLRKEIDEIRSYNRYRTDAG